MLNIYFPLLKSSLHIPSNYNTNYIYEYSSYYSSMIYPIDNTLVLLGTCLGCGKGTAFPYY